MSSAKHDLLRTLPSVDALLQDAELAECTADVPRSLVAEAIRTSVQEVRAGLLSEPAPPAGPDEIRAAILTRIRERLHAAMGPHFRKAINATGIILHTGLGRAVLPARALRQIEEHLSGYSLLQVDVETGRRSRRDERIEWLLQRLTGAEAATVVNNNAAATMIVLNTVARGREVIVSRGQLVEIGGSFRLPEVMAASGARLVEVGTTNRTHARDYEKAVTENTAAILRVHPSNYRISGFTAEAPLEELVRIAHDRGLALIDDVGAGALIDFGRWGFRDQPTLPGSIRAGADLAISSTDKLIGAAQGGIILGRADLIQAVRKNPLARVVRVGKLTLAVLEATLTLFLDESVALREVPTLRMIRRDPSEIAAQAEAIARSLVAGGLRAHVEVVEGCSQVGSGSLPEENLPSRLVAVRPDAVGPEIVAGRLRHHCPPIFARIHADQVLIDPRTLLEGEDQEIIDALVKSLGPVE